MKTDLGERIKQIRLEKGLSQQELADMTGFHRTHINRIENSHRSPQFEDVVKILTCLGRNITFAKNDLSMKSISAPLLKKIIKDPEKYNIQYKTYGKSQIKSKYSDKDFQEMYYGAYRDSQYILTDEGKFIYLKNVVRVICVLKYIECKKEPILSLEKSFIENIQQNIDVIKTFYIDKYQLETIDGSKYNISGFLNKVGAIKLSRRYNDGTYKIDNRSRRMIGFSYGSVPDDLYHVIKFYINGFFFQDDYYLKNLSITSNEKESPNSWINPKCCVWIKE